MGREAAINDALNEMYEEAEPGLDFDEVMDNPNDYPEDWYNQHTLDAVRQREIVQKHSEKYDLNSNEHTALVLEAILSYGPSTPGDSEFQEKV